MKQLIRVEEKIKSVIESGEILIIIPPFISLFDIRFGAFQLQALASERGYKVDILCLNALLASEIGIEDYETIDNAPLYMMLGERLFSRSAYQLPPLGIKSDYCRDEALSISGNKEKHTRMFYEDNHFDLERYLQLEHVCFSFIQEAVTAISSLEYKIIGCNAQSGQINSSIALLKGIKELKPDMATLFGGPASAGKMSRGIETLSDSIDYIFSGESERAFLNFLEEYSQGRRPPHKIIQGEPLQDLDTLPLPNYSIFYKQYTEFLGEEILKKLRIWYETSRGCWWGEKGKCNFCATPGKFREKSVANVLSDLENIENQFPGKLIAATDNIIPASYLTELLPKLAEQSPPPLAYPIRSNLDLEQMVNLKKANIQALLLGIESFSTPLLNRMKKGITAVNNLQTLRYARSTGIYVDWFLLWGFPGDRISDYEEVLRILPLIRHFQPPIKFHPMLITRFSPYFESKAEYNITNLRPWAVNNMIYPPGTEIENIAFYYTANFPCESIESRRLIQRIADEVKEWKVSWKKSRLVMTRVSDRYIIYDARETDRKEKNYVMSRQQAEEVMTGGSYNGNEGQNWAVEQRLGTRLDDVYVPLVTAPPPLLAEFETTYHQSRGEHAEKTGT